MNITIGWAGLGVIVAILMHAAASIWWAAKITNQISNLSLSFSRLDKELEKRDIQIRAIWSKVDNHGERLATVEGKCLAQHGGE